MTTATRKTRRQKLEPIDIAPEPELEDICEEEENVAFACGALPKPWQPQEGDRVRGVNLDGEPDQGIITQLGTKYAILDNQQRRNVKVETLELLQAQAVPEDLLYLVGLPWMEQVDRLFGDRGISNLANFIGAKPDLTFFESWRGWLVNFNGGTEVHLCKAGQQGFSWFFKLSKHPELKGNGDISQFCHKTIDTVESAIAAVVTGMGSQKPGLQVGDRCYYVTATNTARIVELRNDKALLEFSHGSRAVWLSLKDCQSLTAAHVQDVRLLEPGTPVKGESMTGKAYEGTFKCLSASGMAMIDQAGDKPMLLVPGTLVRLEAPTQPVVPLNELPHASETVDSVNQTAPPLKPHPHRQAEALQKQEPAPQSDLETEILKLYSELDEAEQTALRAGKAALSLYLSLGDRLLEIKATLEHGHWLPWLQERGINERKAQRAIQLHSHREALTTKSASLTDLTLTEALAIVGSKKTLKPEPQKEPQTENAPIASKTAAPETEVPNQAVDDIQPKTDGLEGEKTASDSYEYEPIDPKPVWFDPGGGFVEGVAIATNGKGFVRIAWGEDCESDVPRERVQRSDPTLTTVSAEIEAGLATMGIEVCQPSITPEEFNREMWGDQMPSFRPVQPNGLVEDRPACSRWEPEEVERMAQIQLQGLLKHLEPAELVKAAIVHSKCSLVDAVRVMLSMANEDDINDLHELVQRKALESF